MFPYDPMLLAAVRTPPESVADVMQTMQTIAATCIDGDGLKWFNWLYLQVTQAVEARASLPADSATPAGSPNWTCNSRASTSAHESELDQPANSTPAVGRRLFDRRRQAAIARIQFALAGINAHINHDLPLAIVATCQATGTSAATRRNAIQRLHCAQQHARRPRRIRQT